MNFDSKQWFDNFLKLYPMLQEREKLYVINSIQAAMAAIAQRRMSLGIDMVKPEKVKPRRKSPRPKADVGPKVQPKATKPKVPRKPKAAK